MPSIAAGTILPEDSANERTDEAQSGKFALGFVLFLIVNAVLFVRPADLFPALELLPIYELSMIGCMLTSFPAIAKQLEWDTLKSTPVTACALGLLAAIFLSNLLHGNIYDARMGALAFIKVVLYFLMLLGLVNSIKRLRIFLVVVASLTTITAGVTLLQWHGVIDIEALTPVTQWTDEDETGERGEMMRLQGPGIFGDPNDFAVVLVAGMLISSYFVFSPGAWLRRLAWLVPIGLMGYALALTSSRGGLLSLMVGLLVFMVSRWGWRRALPLGAIVLPAFLVVFGGRQTNIDLSNTEDTFQGRVLLWRDGLVLFHRDPVFGIGYGMMAEENGMVAHNSYVHTYAEVGFVGGTCFVGMLYFVIRALRHLRRHEVYFCTDELRRLSLFFLAIITAYAVGIWSLSRPYAIPTYLLVGLIMAYCRLAATETGVTLEQVGQRSLFRLALLGGVVVILLHVAVKVLLA